MSYANNMHRDNTSWMYSMNSFITSVKGYRLRVDFWCDSNIANKKKILSIATITSRPVPPNMCCFYHFDTGLAPKMYRHARAAIVNYTTCNSHGRSLPTRKERRSQTEGINLIHSVNHVARRRSDHELIKKKRNRFLTSSTADEKKMSGGGQAMTV